MQNREHTQKIKTILWGILFFFALCFIFVLVYKAQLAEKFQEPVICTLKSLRKENGSISLSDESPALSQTFTCTIPSLERIRIECQGQNIDSKAKLLALLSDAQTGEEYFRKESSVKKIASESNVKKYSLHLENPLENSEGKALTLSLQLINGNGTILTLTSNTKQGIVQNFNGIDTDKTNIIYDIMYSDCGELVKLYVLLCLALLFFAGVCFYLFVIRHKTISQVYVPLAIILGIIFNFVILVNGVPDEPAHIDTAYKYSDAIMRKHTETDGTIYKRQCDIEMTDMLVNGVESNSYYQLLHHFLEVPENTELVPVSYLDAGHIVPGIVYIPSAVGISIGRLFGLSALFTLSLGRIMNLLTFVFLIWLAIRLIPYGKNMLAMVMLLPISLQQAASTSYDAVINGTITLFIALCLHLTATEKLQKIKLFLLAILAVFIAMTKGGVYLPVCLLAILIYWKEKSKKLPGAAKKTVSAKKILLALCIIAALAVVLLIKYMPIFTSLLADTTNASDADSYYTVAYFVKHPFKIIYLYWNTFIRLSGDHLRGLLGGMLAWLDLKIAWIYLIILYTGMLLLANVDNDRASENIKTKLLLAFISIASIMLIMLSMTVSFTSAELNYVNGLQGRYYLVLLPLMLFLANTRMVHVNQSQCSKISMVMMTTEIMIVLNAVALV